MKKNKIILLSIIVLLIFAISLFKRYKKYTLIIETQESLFNNAYKEYSYRFIENYYLEYKNYPPRLIGFVNKKAFVVDTNKKELHAEYLKLNPWRSLIFDPYSENDSLTYAPLSHSAGLYYDYIIYSVGPDGIDNNKENVNNYNSGKTGDTLFFKGRFVDEYPNILEFDKNYDIMLREPYSYKKKNIIVINYE